MSSPSTDASPQWILPEVASGTTTSWIPLTTPFSSLAGCESIFFSFPGQPGPAGWDPGYGYFGANPIRCLPAAVTTWFEQPHQNGNGYTSISIRPLTCPDVYNTVATSVKDDSSTAVVCCPTGYSWQDNTCLSPLTAGQVITYLGMDTPFGYSSTVTATADYDTSVSAVRIAGWNVDAPPYSITLSTTTNMITTTETAVRTRTETATATTTSTVAASGLSTGAKAGLGVGIPGAFIAGLVLMWLLFRLGIFLSPEPAPRYTPPAAPEYDMGGYRNRE